MIESRPAVTSLCIHVLAVALLFSLAMSHVNVLPTNAATTLTIPTLKPYYTPAAAGGGQQAKGPASRGAAPPHSLRQFVPPMAVPLNLQPKLAMIATMEALPDSRIGLLGDPNSLASLLSGGRGGPAGIGDGHGNQIGPGAGGPGAGTEGVYRAGHGVTLPVVIHKVEPEFSEEARKAHAMGTVVINAEIGPDGKPHNLRVSRSFGMGLDEKALEAVSQWTFRPGTKDGKAVTVAASIEVAFHLL